MIKITGTLDARAYIEQILANFVPQLPRATRKRPVFMQDGASCHTADLNPIENLWGYIENRLKNRVCRSNDELWCEIQQEWNNVPMCLIDFLFNSMPKRLCCVHKAKGRTIKY